MLSYRLLSSSTSPDSLSHDISHTLPSLHTLEHSSYPAAEAASCASLDLRFRSCKRWFVVCEDDYGQVVGFACGTCAGKGSKWSHEVMTTHEPEGGVVGLHSLVVAKHYRRRGVGLRLVFEFVKAAMATGWVEKVRLLTKARHVELYNRAGFSFRGDCAMRHGTERWFEMERELRVATVVCVDAFAGGVFGGNPAAVVLLPDGRFSLPAARPRSVSAASEHVGKRVKIQNDNAPVEPDMQLVAREMNLAETAFIKMISLSQSVFATTVDPLEKIIACVNAGTLIRDMVFNNTLALVKKHFKLRDDVKFRVGSVASERGQNVGSLAMLGFARVMDLSREATVRLWCEHYYHVLHSPIGDTSHPNIRAFLTGSEFEFFDSETNAVLPTPIESFSIEGAAVLAANGREETLQALFRVPTTDVIKEHVTFDAKYADMDDASYIKLFCSFFKIKHDHHDVFAHVTKTSDDFLAILIRGNVLDVPHRLIKSYVVECDTMNAFCKKYELDYQSRLRLIKYANLEWSPGAIGHNSCTGVADYSLRWFTPTVEVDLCGHATLASAHALFKEIGPFASAHLGGVGFCGVNSIRFHTRSGILTARRLAIGKFDIELDFPAQSVEECAMEESKDLKKIATRAFSSLNEASIEYLGRTSTNDLLIVVQTKALFLTSFEKVNLTAMRDFGGRGVCVCAAGDSANVNDVDFYSRFFAPNAGIDEDPVTGSAHCYLAPFFHKRTRASLTKILVGEQASLRGGRVECELAQDGQRVLLRGASFASWSGQVCAVTDDAAESE